MTFAIRHLVAAAVAATSVLAAQAQTAPPQAADSSHGAHAHPGHHGHHKHHGHHDRSQFDPAKKQEHVARRLADLRQKLQLSAAQEAAWTRFTGALQPAPRSPLDRDAWARLTTPERIDQRRALRAERLAAMDRRDAATKAFYSALTPEQQKVFDAETLRGGHGPRARPHHG